MIVVQESAIDWSGCEFVEQVPGRMSGVPVVIGSRVTADSVLENFDGGEKVGSIAYNYTLPRKNVIGVLRFAGRLAEVAA